ncbi:MAG: COX15/CtaA family protein [Deltaproteobacteria bacterium]|nr:COX15/CtaA family protein [Deltaproteobacteria bacterium]
MVGLRHLFFIATLLAFVVVVLGAYTRLSDSGLGCPDWPGCYGQVTPPKDDPGRGVRPYAPTNQQFDSKKAWTEMIHRYFAGTLGLLILVMAVVSIVRQNQPEQPRFLPLVLLGTVIFQALLGMWTVTLLLHPLVVMAHLLGGMTTLGLCWWMYLGTKDKRPGTSDHGPGTKSLRSRVTGHWSLVPFIALFILILQIALGGWVSANYAALACPDFPTCMGHWWPKMDLTEAMTIWKNWGTNSEGGILSNEGRVAIQILHRIGAVVTFLFLGFLAIRCLKPGSSKTTKTTAIILILLLMTQVTLGISTVLFTRPLESATAHNAVAALLLLATLALSRHQA